MIIMIKIDNIAFVSNGKLSQNLINCNDVLFFKFMSAMLFLIENNNIQNLLKSDIHDPRTSFSVIAEK